MSNVTPTTSQGRIQDSPATGPVGAAKTSPGAVNPADVSGAPHTYTGTPASTMCPPKIDAASMMLALNVLQGQTTDLSLDSAAETIKTYQKDIKKLNEQRAKQLETHFDKLTKSSPPERCGLFGAIIKFFKSIVESIKHPEKASEIWADFGKTLKDSVLTVFKDLLAIVATVVGAALMATGAGSVLGALLIAGAVCMCVATVLSDPEIVNSIVSLFPPEKQDKVREIMGYVGMALNILAIVVSLGSGIGAAVKTAGVAIAVATKIVTSLLQGANAVFSGATAIVTAINQKKIADCKVEALKAGAESERLSATLIEIEEQMTNVISNMKSLMESKQKNVESTFRMLTNTASAQRAIVSV